MVEVRPGRPAASFGMPARVRRSQQGGIVPVLVRPDRVAAGPGTRPAVGARPAGAVRGRRGCQSLATGLTLGAFVGAKRPSSALLMYWLAMKSPFSGRMIGTQAKRSSGSVTTAWTQSGGS